MRWRDLFLLVAIIMFVVAAFAFEGNDMEFEAGTWLAIGLAFFAGSLLSEVVS